MFIENSYQSNFTELTFFNADVTSSSLLDSPFELMISTSIYLFGFFYPCLTILF